MGGVIGETLPLGLGIALNPIAIVVAILILGTVNTPKNGIAFAFGWISGLTILLVLTSLLLVPSQWFKLCTMAVPMVSVMSLAGWLPRLPDFCINMYVTRGPRRRLAEPLAQRLRAAFAASAALAAE